MKTCPYCASEVIPMKGGEYHGTAPCPHCDIILGKHTGWGDFTEEGKRVPRKMIKSMVTIDDIQQPLHYLAKFHTYDLLLSLRLARLERSKAYDMLKTFNKAADNLSEEDFHQFTEVTGEAGNEYEYWTRRCWMIENLLMDRMGYFPSRIPDELLAKLKERSLQAQKKSMAISRVRRNKIT